jgi:hypothetical protein
MLVVGRRNPQHRPQAHRMACIALAHRIMHRIAHRIGASHWRIALAYRIGASHYGAIFKNGIHQNFVFFLAQGISRLRGGVRHPQGIGIEDCDWRRLRGVAIC